MRIIKGWFKTEIEIKPGELTDLLHFESPVLSKALFGWLRKYLDFKIIIPKKK